MVCAGAASQTAPARADKGRGVGYILGERMQSGKAGEMMFIVLKRWGVEFFVVVGTTDGFTFAETDKYDEKVDSLN